MITNTRQRSSRFDLMSGLTFTLTYLTQEVRLIDARQLFFTLYPLTFEYAERYANYLTDTVDTKLMNNLSKYEPSILIQKVNSGLSKWLRHGLSVLKS
jgi:hypothetical protein